MVNQKLGFITVAICFGYITTLTGLPATQLCSQLSQPMLWQVRASCFSNSPRNTPTPRQRRGLRDRCTRQWLQGATKYFTRCMHLHRRIERSHLTKHIIAAIFSIWEQWGGGPDTYLGCLVFITVAMIFCSMQLSASHVISFRITELHVH